MSLATQIAARMLGQQRPKASTGKKPAKPEPLSASLRKKLNAGPFAGRAPVTDAELASYQVEATRIVASIAAGLSAPPPAPLAQGWRGSCKAICAETGRQCRLPAHPSEPDRHRHERGPFHRTAVPGQAFSFREQLDRAATRRIHRESP
jgi:hypothetical protein